MVAFAIIMLYKLIDGPLQGTSSERDHPLALYPTAASWPNLVGRRFTEFTCKHIRRGTFQRGNELNCAISEFVRKNNVNTRPFIWTTTTTNIIKRIKYCKEALDARRRETTRMQSITKFTRTQMGNQSHISAQ